MIKTRSRLFISIILSMISYGLFATVLALLNCLFAWIIAVYPPLDPINRALIQATQIIFPLGSVTTFIIIVIVDIRSKIDLRKEKK